MLELIGATGSFLLAFCALPEVISSIRKGYCGTSYGLLLTWGIGECLTLYYVNNTSKDLYLMANYLVNLAFIVILLYYKTQPVKKDPVQVLDFTHLKD
jgi:hypothetical protein